MTLEVCVVRCCCERCEGVVVFLRFADYRATHPVDDDEAIDPNQLRLFDPERNP